MPATQTAAGQAKDAASAVPSKAPVEAGPVAAQKDIEALPTLYEKVVSQAEAWLSAHMLSWVFAVQVLAIIIAGLLAWYLTRSLSGKIYAFVHRRTNDDDPWLRRIAQRADELVFFAGFMVLLYGFGFTVKALGQEHAAIFATANLANAWIVIRMVSTVVLNPFWSKLFAVFAWTVAALNILGLLGTTAKMLDSLAFSVGDTRLSIYLILKAVLLSGLLLWGAFAVSRLVQVRIEKIDELTPSVRELIIKVLRFALILLAVLAALSASGIDLTALAVFSGALGIGIGFGLQKVVSNFVAGVIVLLDRSIRPADVIQIGDTFGRVVKLGSRYTSVITRDGYEYLIPNEDLITKEVINWSFSDRNVRRKVPIGISYDSDIELARKLVIEAARETPRILDFPSPLCHLTGFGESAVHLEARFWLSDPENGVTNAQSDFLRKVWAKFREHGIVIPFPQRDVNFTPKTPIEVKIVHPSPHPSQTSRARRRRRRDTKAGG